jgi:hypothetical protein
MRNIAIAFALCLAACGGNDDAPAPADPKPAPTSSQAEEERDPALTKREVDQKLDDIERQIESGDVDQRVVVAE